MFVCIFFLVIMVGMFVAGRGYSKLAERMKLFRSTTGAVLERSVVPIPTGDTRTGAFGDGGGYMPRVLYRYTVDGVAHESDKMSFSVQGWKHAVAERRLAEIPAEVTVWYDPDQPSVAYLHKHKATMGYLFMGAAIFGALCDVLVIVAKLT